MKFHHSGDGMEIAYHDTGRGTPIVCVHGVGAYKESWQGVAELLPEGYRCIRYDLRGHGDSSPVPGPYSLDGLAQDLKELLDHLGLEQVILAGFSLGGLIAQRFALSHPERVGRLILVSTVAARTDEEKTRVAERLARLKEQGAEGHLSQAVDRWFTADFIKRRPEIIEERRKRILKNDPASYRAAYEVLATSDLGDLLVNISTRTLVMTGENDIGSTPRMAAVIKERIPDCRLRIVPSLKHSLLLEAPDTVVGEIIEFLNS